MGKSLDSILSEMESHWRVLEKTMATHCRILAWEIPRTEELGRLLTVHGVTKELDMP